jgi:acetylornithine deacetylase/succinyl-diaminopimelate desuccinylase-like protein
MSFEQYLKESQDKHLDELFALLRIPSISALEEHRSDCAQAAAWLAERMKQAGLEHVEVFPTAGHPLVYGDWLHNPDAPTVLIYGHYDVQPVDPLELWHSAPFSPQVRNDRIWARGASDDKGQLLLHVQAIETILETAGGLPINVKALFEGEEEIGSPHLSSFITEHADQLAADLVVISDTGMVASGVPTICCGLRGICTLEVSLTCANTDCHSGFGGAIPNALHELTALLGQLHDKQNKVTVPGFYDAVQELSEAQREQLAAVSFSETELLRRLALNAFTGETDYTVKERMSIRPTLELNGLWGGFQGEGSKTVIPAQAFAKISCRLVPDQDPQHIAQLVADRLKSLCPPYALLDVKFGHGGRPFVCDPDTPEVQAISKALSATFGHEVAMERIGGSIPIVDTFASVLKAPIILMGFAPPDANAHAPNESMELSTWRLAGLAICRAWYELS